MGSSGDLGRRLLDLKEQIEAERAKKSELQGELNGIMSQLEDQFDVTSLDQAQERIAQETETVKELEQQLEDEVEALEEMMSE